MKKSLAVLLTILLLTGCHRENLPETDTASGTHPKTEKQTETLPETAAETESVEPEPDLPPADPIPEPEKTEPYIRLLSGAENFTCTAVAIPGEYRRSWRYDEDHILYMTCDPVTDEAGRAIAYENKHFYMVDLTTGSVAADTAFGDAVWDTFYAYGKVLYHYRLDEETGTAYAEDPLVIQYTPETGITFLSATHSTAVPPVTEFTPYPQTAEWITSPDGRYQILLTLEGGDGSGGMDLLYTSDLTTVRLFENILLDDLMPNGRTAGIGDVRIYAPVGFVDDTRFVYRIGGWEWTVGYGIWDLVTGQYTETTGYGIYGVHDGYLYLSENTSTQQYMVTGIYKATPEGERTLIASADKEDGVFWMENTDEYFSVPTYGHPYWITSVLADPDNWSAAGGNAMRYTIWSPDLTEELAVIEKQGTGDWYIHENRITYVALGETALFEKAEPPVETEQPDTVRTEPGEPYIRLLSGEENFRASVAELPEGEWSNRWYYDDTHILWLTYDRIAGERNETLSHTNRYLSMLDLETGEIAATLPLEGEGILNEATWDGDGLILYNLILDETTTTYTAGNALRITFTDGQLSAEPTETLPFPVVTKQIVSPDGQYRIRRIMEDGWGRGGMDLVYPDGSAVRLFTGTVLGDPLPDGSIAADIQHVRGYTPLAFLDNTRFVYTINGWEHCWGYGIWDLATGLHTEFTENVEYVYTVHEGYIYLTSSEPCETGRQTKVWKVTPEGERTLLAAAGDDTTLFPLDELYDPLYCAGEYWIYTTGESLFSMSSAGVGQPKTYQVWSADMDRILAEFALDGWTMNRVFFCGKQITYIP